MQFSDSIVRGRLLKRYKRFLADVELSDGSSVVAHCGNPGSMLGLLQGEGESRGEGQEVWLLPNRNPAAKLAWRWEVVVVASATVGSVAVGINTGRANDLVAEALAAGVVGELSCYGDDIRREVKVGDGARLDFLLGGQGEGLGEGCYIEVKSVTMSRRSGLAEFPDSETKRGLKHLRVLGNLAEAGQRAILLYVVQRGDCSVVSVAGDIDGNYLAGLREVIGLGVEVLAYGCDVSEGGIFIKDRLQFQL